jgi:hypothetical protein
MVALADVARDHDEVRLGPPRALVHTSTQSQLPSALRRRNSRSLPARHSLPTAQPPGSRHERAALATSSQWAVCHPRELDPCSCADSSGSRVAHSVGPPSREWAVASRVARTRRTSRKRRHVPFAGLCWVCCQCRRRIRLLEQIVVERLLDDCRVDQTDDVLQGAKAGGIDHLLYPSACSDDTGRDAAAPA